MDRCPNECEEATQALEMGLKLRFCPACGEPIETVMEPAQEVEDAENDLVVYPTSDEVRIHAAISEARNVAFEMPDKIGEVIGWRAWNVTRLGKIVRLSSVTHSAHWPAQDWVYAECGDREYQYSARPEMRTCQHSADGRVPGDDCTCGLYAAKDRHHLDDLGYNKRYAHAEGITIVGQVAMAGKVIEGDQGWRGEKARVYKLYVPFDRALGQALANQYRVPVEMVNVYDLNY
jgi:hypothetical protein